MYDGPNWTQIIRTHATSFANEERLAFDEARNLYQGKYWSQKDRDTYGSIFLISMNFIFAITESAVASTVPRNLQFTASPATEEASYVSNEVEQYVTSAGRAGNWREEATISMVDATLTGRSILKTTMTDEDAFPTIRAVDPRRIFFDLSARRPGDVGYYIEHTLLTCREFDRRVKRGGKYKLSEKVTAQIGKKGVKELATGYPVWLSEEAAKAQQGGKWIEVWEVYDIETSTCTHWISQQDEPLVTITGEDFFNPYTMYNLNWNGQDCRGLSEVQLVKELVQACNRILTYLGEIVATQVPTLAYDKSLDGADGENTLASVLGKAGVGGYVGINGGMGDIAGKFYQLPVANIPPDVLLLLGKIESIIQFVSAQSDNARGQVSGARTATELAVIESAQQNRLGQRTARFQRAWAEAVGKGVYLASRILKRPIPVRDVEGQWSAILPDSLLMFDGSWEMVPYSPSDDNRGVLQERFDKVYQYAQSRPDAFDVKKLDEMFVDIYRLPKSVLLRDDGIPVDVNAEPVDVAPPVVPEPQGAAAEAAPPDQSAISPQVAANLPQEQVS